MYSYIPLRIYVVAHKPCDIPSDGVFEPIHVGRTISKYKDEMAWMQGDDTGDNISQKNAQYCEMTAHYWIWKNVHDTEYVGVCHYRRFFGLDITEDSIKDLMADADVMLVAPTCYVDSVYSYFAKYMGAENMTILSLVMKKRCPDYFRTLEKICDDVKFHPFNMLLCKKTLFNDYCEWMFGILEECERYVKPSPYTNARRALAYMAEMLTGTYFIHRGLKIKSVPYYMMENGQKVLEAHEESDSRKFDDPAILLGLKNDGIVIE